MTCISSTASYPLFFSLEQCDDNDRGLFQNDVSEIQLDESNSREIVVESFESANSDDNEWMNSLSPKKEDLNYDKGNSVSSRALAWMSSMEKKSNKPTQRKKDLPKSLAPPSIVSDRVTTRRIQSRYSSGAPSNATPLASYQQHVTPKSKVGELISKLENPSKKTPFAHTTEEEIERDVIFHSNAMGIRLKRGEDGLVRVVSVTESSPGSSIIRDGLIEPDDILMEAAGADLRSPISNSRWGEVVQIIRNASRPMKFVIVSGRKAPSGVNASTQAGNSMRNRSIRHTTSTELKSSTISFSDDSFSSSQDDETTAKQSIFNRIASCAVPEQYGKSIRNCAMPEQSEKSTDKESNEVPMAHLAFLRTNPTIVRVRSEASRRYPALCGRPDTIFEEPEDTEVRGRQFSQQSPSMDRSLSNSYDSSALPSTATGPARTSNNVAYLEHLASKSTVFNKPTRTWKNNMQKLSERSSSPEVSWPNSDGPGSQDIDAVSSYSSKSQLSFRVTAQKKETARPADKHAESNVVAMTESELHDLNSSEACEV